MRFCYLNILCLRINITLIFMNSSSNEFTHVLENSKTDVSVGFRRLWCPSKGHQHGVSIQSLLHLGTTLFRISRIMKYRTDLSLGEAFCIFIFFHFPDSGLSVLNGMHFYLLWCDSENREMSLAFRKNI